MESSAPLPRVTIQFCTQCKWMLRAAYFAQELLSTFSTSLGEVALQPSTGGIFFVKLYHGFPSAGERPASIQEHLLWDRKAEGGFPETKELKKRVRNIIDPTRDLGHVDGHKASSAPNPDSNPSNTTNTTSSSSASSIGNVPASSQPNVLVEGTVAGVPIPRAINRLQSNELYVAEGHGGERKFTPMDVDVSYRRASAAGERQREDEEVLGPNGKIRITGGDEESFGFCRPGDEDCG